MGLTRVWLQTFSDGLIRADQVIGVEAHETPALTGKTVHWLLDVVLAVPIGSGGREEWMVTALHRTLVQTGHDPTPACAALVRLLAQLDAVDAAGTVSAVAPPRRRSTAPPTDATAPDAATTSAGGLQLRFSPFADPEPGAERP